MKTSRRGEGISEAIGFVLILAAVIVTLTIYLLYMMPTMGRENEISQMSQVKERFSEFKLDIDTLWTSRQRTTEYGPALTLGSGETGGILGFFPFFRPAKAGAVLALNQRVENITISSESYFLVSSGGLNQSGSISFAPSVIPASATPQHFFINISAADLLTRRGARIQGPAWDAWVNVTPNYFGYTQVNLTWNETGKITSYTNLTQYKWNSTDITVSTYSEGRSIAINLPVYRNISSSTMYPVDLMSSIYGISGQFQNPQGVTVSLSDNTGLLTASYLLSYGYFPNVSSSTWDMGSIEYRSNNIWYTPQTYYYQLGGVFLEQEEGSTSEVPPSISLSMVNSSPVVRIGKILILGSVSDANVSGSGPITMTSAVTDIVNAPLPAGNNTKWVNLTIQAASVNAARMWNRTLKGLADQGGLPLSSYTTGTAGNVAFLYIAGDPQQYDIRLSISQVNVSADYVLEYTSGGISRSWRNVPGYVLPSNITETGTTTTPPTESYPWYDCAWAYRKNITIDHTKVSGDQTDFPVLISLSSDADLSSHAQSDGDDILFTASDGTTNLSHEIESYSSGTLVAWVKVPSLSSSSNTTIMMYYGNSVASNQQDAANVWDTNYKAIWHHDHDLLDSTSNGNTGTNSKSTNGAAKIGRAQSYPDVSDTYVDVGSGASIGNLFAGGGTVSAWIYPNSWGWGSFGRIVDKSNSTNQGFGWAFYVDDDSNDNNNCLRFGRSRATQRGNWVSPNNSIALSQWQYVVVTYNEDSTSNDPLLYINGVSQTVTEPYTPTGSLEADDASNMRIGNFGGGTGRTFYGIIDEVRLSTNIRSAGRIATEFANQNSPSTFSSLGSQVGAPSSPCGGTPTPTPTITPTPTPTPPGGVPWFSCNWDYRKKITIDHTKVSATQTDFPVLVNLSSDADLAADARDDGYDIVFTSSDRTTKLSHEIESFSGSTGALVAWVKVPSLSSTTDTELYMYYGYPSSPNQQDPTNVWDTNFKAVWHLKEDPSGAAPQMKDSTSIANHGTSKGGMASGAQVAGKIDGSLNFDGSNDNVTAPDYDILNAITISAWINRDAITSYDGIISKRVMTENAGDWVLRADTTTGSKLQWILWYGTDLSEDFATVSSLSAGTWTHVVMTFNDSTNTAKFYLNGSLDKTDTTSFTTGSLVNNPEPIIIGYEQQNDTAGFFDGKIDEVRLSSTVRSPEWIATEYANQNSPGPGAGSFISSLGSEEPYSSCGGPAYVQSRSLRAPDGSSRSITLPGASISGDLMILNVLICPQDRGVTSVSDPLNGAYNLAVDPTNVGIWGKAYTYYKKNIASGSTTITVTLNQSTSCGVFDLFALEYSGLDTSSPLDQTSSNTGNGNPMDSGSKTITSAPSLIYGFGADDGYCLADPPYINRETLWGQCAADRIVTSTGSYSVVAYMSSSTTWNWSLQMATFKGA